MFCPEGKQPRLAITFRCKGKRSWHPGVDVFFHENTQTNTKVCLKWDDKNLKKFVNGKKLERSVRLVDNREANILTGFIQPVSKISVIIWYGIPNATDLSQPVDNAGE